MELTDTIVGLSSGSLPSGIATVRISGPSAGPILHGFAGDLPDPRFASLRSIIDPLNGELIDRGLVLWFPGPASFTGEDCAEIQLHGSLAVVDRLLEAVLMSENVRLAEAGEFSRRAFENGRLDLTAAEGLADLISARTESQRKLALTQSMGSLNLMYSDWRERLVRIQAMYAAEIDFVDEDDVPENAHLRAESEIAALVEEICAHLDDNRAGEIIRDGYKVVIAGPPNAGKSSLLNALSHREVAIVTDEAGTTRDVLDVHLNIGGFEVLVSDTAGIRQSDNKVEQEGIRRARLKIDEADLVLVLFEEGSEDLLDLSEISTPVLSLKSKDDQGNLTEGRSISVKTGHGIDWLLNEIKARVSSATKRAETGLITRKRYRDGLLRCHDALSSLSGKSDLGIELVVETLRESSDHLGKITGRVDVEDLLDVIFSEFCVGK